MNTGETAKYRLVVFRKPDDTDPVKTMLARELGIHPLDAQRLTAHMPGILPGLYDAATCKRVLDGLFTLQIPAEARSLESFPDLSRPRIVHDLALTAGGLNIRDNVRKQTLHFLPWNQIGMIAAAKVRVPEIVTEYVQPGITRGVVHGVRRMLGGGALNRKERLIHSPVSPKGEAIVWRKRPHGVFRLSEDKLRYEVLGEHRADTAAENFPKLLRWLATGSEEAFLTDSTSIYMGQEPGDVTTYPDMETFVESATMQLLKHWYKTDKAQAEES